MAAHASAGARMGHDARGHQPPNDAAPDWSKHKPILACRRRYHACLERGKFLFPERFFHRARSRSGCAEAVGGSAPFWQARCCPSGPREKAKNDCRTLRVDLARQGESCGVHVAERWMLSLSTSKP